MNEEQLGGWFFARIRNRMLKNNKNWLAVCCGETGSGKSYSALAMADAISPRGITIKRNVVFSPKELLERINNPQDLCKGDIIIFDESGVGMSAREWYSIQNKLLGAILQTFRNLNVGVIFTTPNLSFMDVQARKLLHNYFETSHLDYKEELAYLKVYNIQHNSRLDKTYYKYPVFTDENGRFCKAKFLAIPKIRAELAEEYESVKSAYTQDLNAKALAELTTPQQPKNFKDPDAESKALEKLRKEYKGFVRQIGKREFLDHGGIMSAYDLSHHGAMRIKHAVENEKGIGTRKKDGK